MTSRRWVWLVMVSILVAAGASMGVAPAAGAVLLNETFTGSTTTAPVFGLGTFFPCLTARSSGVAAEPLPGCESPPVDASGSGALRLTDSGGQVSGLFYNGSITTSEGLEVTFNQYQYGGSIHGDGIAFVLAVAPPVPGSVGTGGGSLGYNGLPGGWLGIGFDVFGAYSTPGGGGSGCTPPAWATGDLPNEVIVRGPGYPNGGAYIGYCNLSSSADGTQDDPLGPAGFQLGGADRSPDSKRSVKIVIDPVAGTYSVAIDPAGGTAYVPVTSGSLPAFYYDPSTGDLVTVLPPSITFGWTAGTGAADDIHEITDVVVKTLYTPGTTTFAQSVPNIAVPATGTSTVTLGNVEIDENVPGALSTSGTLSITLPSPLTFVGTPSVSVTVSNGLAVGSPSVDAETKRTVSLSVTAQSSTNPGKLVFSNLKVSVPSGTAFGSLCGVELPGNPVCVTVDGTNGVTPVADLEVATFTSASAPVVSSLSMNSVADGTTVDIILFGSNLDVLVMSDISFGDGITVLSILSQSATQLKLRIQVSGATSGLRDIVISYNGVTTVFSDQLTVKPKPVVTSAGTGPAGCGDVVDGSGDPVVPCTSALFSPLTGILKGQKLTVTGKNFEAPSTVPSNLVVTVNGTGITVNSVAFASENKLVVDVDVAGGLAGTTRKVTVTNPDLGSGTSATAVLSVTLAPADAPVGLAPTTSGTVTAPSAPTVTSLTPSAAAIGATITIKGSKFSATPAYNIVTFTSSQNQRLVAIVTSATTSALKVLVPLGAGDGPVRVAVNGVQQSTAPLSFTVTDPRLDSVAVNNGQAAAKRGDPTVTLDLFGAKFQSGAVVSFDPAAGLTLGTVTLVTTVPAGTHLQVPVTASATAALGFRDVKVTNPDGTSSTLPKSFAVNGDLTLKLKTLAGPDVTAAFLPSVENVHVTLDATGTCNPATKTVTPSLYIVEATYTGSGAPPASLRFTLTSSAVAGTATNEDCEVDPATPDYSIHLVGAAEPLDVSSQQVVVANGGGGAVIQAKLASWDWGGTVQIDVVDPARASVAAGLGLPINGVPQGTAKAVADGLTNFEKYRGVYLVAPANGNSGDLQEHHRLDRGPSAGMKNLFVRGRGFSTDLTMPGGTCGVDSLHNDAPQPTLTGVPCPVFQVGAAFRNAGVYVWDVTSSFDAAGTTVFPTRSLADPVNKPMLDLATVKYDTANCSGGASCDHTSKLGPRQWNFPTLGFSTFGSCCAYGNGLVLGKPFKAYFLDRPYLHQTTGPVGAFLDTPGPLGPMLAPITTVCDKTSGGSDNGTVQTGECSVGGMPAGDVYLPGQFSIPNGMTAMDVNNDGCVELPFVADPTTLTNCATHPGYPDSATAPQATFQQVVRSIITHELGHAVGMTIHTSVVTDLMYMYSINWNRDNSFSGQASALMQIHNKGQQ